ncbi:putative immunoglobulin-blocking virulence protein [Mycoplasma sp. CSL7475-4]|uniref:putative immunoglobulin-blocking virulence protein n=1 Tax=Mycoplasma sp. CSL7475-4 TaxID=2973942 RepID=UPI00216B34B9|nr:putative immunoglobulin-blocking virulence protein [Mycoplasma sp. CSL7475-4]MCS4536787.1 putative immunoglobulin-blocking virulence protein [Mycoplasma sp. CSL7475-4]
MAFLKRKKIVLSLSSATVIVSSVTAVLLYQFNSKKQAKFDYFFDAKVKEDFTTKNNLDLNVTSANADNNLKELKVPESIHEPIREPEKPKVEEIVKIAVDEEKPKPKPIPKAEPKPKPKPVPLPDNQPQVQPKPKKIITPKVAEEKEVVKPKTPSNVVIDNLINNDDSATIINILGANVRAKVIKNKNREVNSSDIRNKISNIDPYQNNTVDKIVSIQVTDELVNKVLDNVKGDGTGNNGINNRLIKGTVDELLAQVKPENLEDIVNVNKTGFYTKQFEKWKQLFDSNNVEKFLLPDAKTQYRTKKFVSKVHRYFWLYSNLDWSKFTKLSDNAKKMLAEGYVISEDTSYFNEKGELDSWSASLPKGYNSVEARMTRDNFQKRVFSYSSSEIRSPYNVKNGIYPGWTRVDVTDNVEFKDLHVSKADGINIIKMTRDEPINDKGQINEGYVLEIDAGNESGYQKTKQLLIDLKAKPDLNFVSFRIKNMGSHDAGQKFKEILDELPDQIPQLELFFSDRATNTGSLITLENKVIKELSLYTLGNSLLDNWSINPFALRNTKWVNTNDYNVSFEYKVGEEIATRITFNTLSFDAQDYASGSSNPFERINLGLRMAYYARNNEPIFQGGFGSGLNPDENEGGNSYATGLDFSRVPQIKSLRGLVFHDEFKPANKARKISRLVLYNNSTSFTMSAQDLNNAGMEHMVDEPMQSSKIIFSNGATTKRIKIEGNQTLTNSGIANLFKFIKFAKNGNEFSDEIEVDAEATQLKTQLQNSGLKVREAQDFDFA